MLCKLNDDEACNIAAAAATNVDDDDDASECSVCDWLTAACAQFLVNGCGRSSTAIRQLLKDDGRRVSQNRVKYRNFVTS